MGRRAAEQPGYRALKVGEAIRHALADLLARGVVRDPALDAAIVSVSEVRVSPDLRHATAYVMPLGADAAARAAVLAALNAHARAFRHAVAERVNTRYAAEIRFRIDSSFDEAARIEALLRSPRVARDLGPAAPPRRRAPPED